MIISYLEQSYKDHEYKVESHFLFPIDFLDFAKHIKPNKEQLFIINPKTNEY